MCSSLSCVTDKQKSDRAGRMRLDYFFSACKILLCPHIFGGPGVDVRKDSECMAPYIKNDTLFLPRKCTVQNQSRIRAEWKHAAASLRDAILE